MRSESDANRAIEEYADMVRRICLVYLKNRHDTEDIFQTVMLKYILCDDVFESGEHEKAWFIRVTVNACKDYLRSYYRKHTVALEAIAEESEEIREDHSEVLLAVLSLPQKYKDVVYLYYYEDYTAAEIARVLGKKENTVYTLLSRAKKLLRERLGGEAE